MKKTSIMCVSLALVGTLLAPAAQAFASDTNDATKTQKTINGEIAPRGQTGPAYYGYKDTYSILDKAGLDVGRLIAKDAMKPSILANKVITQEETSRIESEIDVLKNCRIDTSFIERINVAESGNEYILKYKNNVDEKVIIKNNDAESTTIIVSSGEKRNELSFEKDGSIILDGFKVQISEVSQAPQALQADKMDTNLAVTPYGTIYKSVKSLSPYGSFKPSDYNTYLSSGKQNIALGKAVNTLAFTTLATLISYTTPYIGIPVSLVSIAIDVYAVIEAINPTTEYLGCAYTTYTAGYDDYQYYNRFYANTACTGNYSLQISYEHFTVY